VLGAIGSFAASSPAHGTDKIADEIYVWQRASSPAVDDAVAWAQREFAGVNRLWLEADWQGATPRIAGAAWADAAGSASAPRPAEPVGLSLRIAAIKGRWGRYTAGLATIARTACERLRTLRSHQPITELQIDFDAYPSQLADYTKALQTFAACAAPTPVRFTALPSWLEAADFAPLAHAFPRYVLQLHGLEQKGNAAPSLYRSQAARDAVARAQALGVPFRIALPAYLYQVVSEPGSGRIVAVDAEQSPRLAPDAATRTVVGPDVAALAADLALWRRSPPPALIGRIWFRVPVDGDEHAFSRDLLADLAAGRAPRVQPVGSAVRRASPQLADVVASGNTGFRQPMPRAIDVTWRTGDLLAADVFHPCRIASRAAHAAHIVCDTGSTAAWLTPGAEKLVMWLRVARAEEVQAHAHD
jgi:hypothetical protein